jgi:hypothetical protein
MRFDAEGWFELDALLERCAELGLPEPESVVWLGARGRSVVFGLAFGGETPPAPRELWLELAPPDFGSALQRQDAAIRAARAEPGVPAPPLFDHAPDRRWGRWVAIRPAGCAVPGAAWLAERPEDWPALAAALGAALAEVQQVPMGHFGLLAEDGRFFPSRGSWREEWMAHVHALADRLVERGLDLGPLTDRAMARIRALASALDGVVRFGLVHGQLGPQSFDVDGGPDGTLVLRLNPWDDALAGDPAVEAAALLALPSDLLAPVLAAAGRELAEGWLQPGVWERVELYHLTWCLRQLVQVGDHLAVDGDRARLVHLERLRAHLGPMLEPGACRERLERAVRGIGHAGPWRSEQPSAAAARLRITLAGAASQPPRPPSEALLTAASIACALVAAEAGRPAEESEALLLVAHAADSRVPWAPSADHEPIPDPGAWSRRLTADLLSEPTGDSSALVTWWMATAGLAAVGGEASAATLRGLERLVRGAHRLAWLLGSQVGALQDRRLTLAVLGLGAAHGLVRFGLASPAAARPALGAWRAALEDAAFDLEPGVAWQHAWALPAAAAMPREDHSLARGVLAPMLFLALTELQGREAIPGGPAWLLDRFGT